MHVFLLAQMFLQPLYGSIVSFFNIALRNKGWSHSMIGVATALGQMTTIAGPILVALVAERRGREKQALVICLLVSLGFHIPFFIAQNAVVTGLCYVLSCAFLWSLNPLMDGLVSKNLTGSNGSYGNIRAAGTLGYVFFMVMFSVLGFPSSSSNLQMMLNNAVISVAFLFSVLLVPGKSIPSGSGKPVREKDRLFDFRWFDRSFYTFILFVSISRISMTVIDKMLATYMVEELGLGKWFTAFIALGAFVEFFCMIAGAAIFRKGSLSPFAMIMISCAGISVRLVLYCISKSVVLFAAAQLLHGICYGFCHVASVQWIWERVEQKHYSAALSIYHCIAINFPVLPGSLAGGFILDVLGYRALFLIYAVFPIMGMLYGVSRRRLLV